MKIIKESTDTYDKREIIDYVLNEITNDDRFFNIQCAYDSDVSNKDSVNDVKSKISEYVDDIIINELDGDPDFDDQVLDIISNDNSGELKDINDYFEFFGDQQMKIWNDERDYQNREYRRTR